jgi:serine/threonine protein kinase/formylglycine-generating enzyme required for sulfatase activity
MTSPHVVQIYDHGETDDGVPYMVMELLRGQPLSERLRASGPQSSIEASVIISQVAKALSEAHRRGVIHRDIKPDNIFVLASDDDDLFVKVLDFGIAKRSTPVSGQAALTATGSLLGTPEYMSPEQILTAKEVGPAADQWALAAVAYECLTGKRAYSGEAVGAVILAIISRKYTPPTEFGLLAEFDTFFERAFHEQPEARFESAKVLARSFAAVCGRAPSSRDSGTGPKPEPKPAPLIDKEEAKDPPDVPPDDHDLANQETLLEPDEPREEDAAAKDDAASKPGVRTAKGLGPTDDSQAKPAPPDPTVVQEPDVATADASPDMLDHHVFAPLEPHDAPHDASELVAEDPPRVPTLDGAAASLAGLAKTKRKGRSLIGLAAAALALVAVGFAVTADDDEPADASVTAAKIDTDKIDTEAFAPPGVSISPVSTEAPLPPSMVKVPAGSYPIGCNDEDGPGCYRDEKPRHRVTLAAFAIMKFEVAMGDYDICVAKAGCPPAGKGKGCHWQKAGLEERSANCVDHAAATSYCVSKGWRLPTEQEWEAAASGPDGKPFVPGETDRSWISARDMAGSMREWTASAYAGYPGGTEEKGRRGWVNRGGSNHLIAKQDFSRSHTRHVDDGGTKRPDLGFRCAMDR